MANFKQLSREDRNNIEHLINKGFNFTEIGEAIHYDRTTISKEIRRNRYIKNSFFSHYSKTGIEKALKSCSKLSLPPYCCNSCPNKCYCTKYHLYYNSKIAQEHYEETLIDSRIGVDISEEEIGIINKEIVPLIKEKKQSVNQVYINHPDILYFSKTTFYSYVNKGIIALDNLDLQRKSRYKPRKKKYNKKNKRDVSILIGRTYEDYCNRVAENKNDKIWQLDTVIGLINDSKCLMTFLLVETNYMLIRLLDKKSVLNVNQAFDNIKNALGQTLYSSYINVILTDNGSEFYDPIHIEYNLESGEKLCSLYYCHPNSPEEKAELEKNHEYIRYVLPKKTSFENLTIEDIKRLEDNINNIPREILGNKTPYDLTKEKYPELINKMESKYISPDEVSLNKDDIILSNKS